LQEEVRGIVGLGKAILLVAILVLIAGIGAFAYQAYSVAKNISVVDSKLSSLWIDIDWGVVPFFPFIMPTKVKSLYVTVTLTIDNPSSYSVEIENLHYEVYIEDTYLGYGDKSRFAVMPSRQQISFSLTASTGDLLGVIKSLLESAVKSGLKSITVHYRVRGIIKVPIKLFNVIEVPALKASIPFDVGGSYTYTFQMPSIPKPSIPPPSPPSGGSGGGGGGILHGRVYGRVVDSSTGSPIRGAEVRLSSVTHTYSDTTDEDGRFSFNSVLVGLYKLEVTKSGYEKYEKSLFIKSGDNDLGTIRLVKKSAPSPPPPSEGTLKVVNAYWTVDGRVVTEAKVGERVTAVVILKAIGGSVSGTVEVKVFKELKLLPDVKVASRSFATFLRSGESILLRVQFTPDGIGGVLIKGYYVKVYFDGEEIWEMENAYPPRLREKE